MEIQALVNFWICRDLKYFFRFVKFFEVFESLKFKHSVFRSYFWSRYFRLSQPDKNETNLSFVECTFYRAKKWTNQILIEKSIMFVERDKILQIHY